MVKIEIDGQELQVPQGAMIIEAADKAGISVPRFCYHKKLSIAANCRMCLVDVENVGKPLPACATPVSEGMKVYTQTKKALDAQKAVMEFLLINHPLDCPICDQGGQCELQDVALEYGESFSRFTEEKRVVKDLNLGPLIETEMTRCIHCTRCVRFGREIAGVQELGATGRGEHVEIGTYIEKSMNSELSGNVIDLCPVGALTSKPFRYSARTWELYRQPAVSMHDGLGSNLYYHVKDSRVLRVGPRENEALNEVWLSDRDRFAYKGLNSADRLSAPEIKVDGHWQVVEWQVALEHARQSLNNVIQSQPEQVGVLASPNSTVEELYLLKKCFDAKGVKNLDHRIHQQDFSDQSGLSDNPGFEISLTDLQSQEAIVVIGSLLQNEAPLINHRIRQASLGGTHICVINPAGEDYTFVPAVACIHLDLIKSIAELAKALDVSSPALADVSVGEDAESIANIIKQAKSTAMVVGQWVETHPHRSTIYALLEAIKLKTGVSINSLSAGSNSRGAWAVEMLPEAGALNASSMFDAKLKAYVLHNIEPELECADPAKAIEALSAAQTVVMVTPYVTALMRQYATVLLPCVPATETNGTFINYVGDWQSFRAVVKPLSDARPAWKILRVLGNLFGLSGFEFTTTDEVLTEARMIFENKPAKKSTASTINVLPSIVLNQSGEFQRLAPRGLYDLDNVVRRSEPLQSTVYQDKINSVRVHPAAFLSLGIKQGATVKVEQAGQLSDSMIIVADSAVPLGAAVVAAARPAVQNLGGGFCNIRIITNVA
jgi:NADH-quinone oxidoreductase subunit G